MRILSGGGRMLMNAMGVRSKAFKSAYDAQQRTFHADTLHRRVRMHTRCTGSALNPSTCPIRMADAVQSLRRRGPADARDLLFQRNQAAGVMSTMSTLSC